MTNRITNRAAVACTISGCTGSRAITCRRTRTTGYAATARACRGLTWSRTVPKFYIGFKNSICQKLPSGKNAKQRQNAKKVLFHRIHDPSVVMKDIYKLRTKIH